MRASLVGLVLAGALVASACGIDAVGSFIDPNADGGGPLGTPGPGARGVGDDGGPANDDGGSPLPCADACAVPSAPAPFALVLLGNDAAACPTGFDASDVVDEPTPNAGSCACGACAFSGTTCTTGALVSKYSSDTACGGTGSNIDANGGACFAFNGQFISTYAAMLPPAAVVGTCSAPGVGVRAKVTTTKRRLCAPRSDACLDAVCAAGSSLATCFAAPGDVACPASLPTRHVVGSDFTLACDACTCTTQATCSGNVTFYSNAGCTGSTRVLQSSTCTQVNQASFQSTKWAGTVASQTCTNVTPAAKANATLADVKTICCP